MKNKIYYFTPIVGIVACMALYILLRGHSSSELWLIIIQAAVALVVYYGIAFAAAYICRPTLMLKEEKSKFPFSFLPAKSDNNLVYALMKFVGVMTSPDYVICSYVGTSLDNDGRRRFCRRFMYLNVLISFCLIVTAYVLSLVKLNFAAKLFTIIVLIRIISRGVQVILTSVSFLFDKEYRSKFKPTFMPEYAITTVIEMFFLFFHLYLLFTNGINSAIYCALRIFTFYPQFISGLNMRCQYLMVIQSALTFVVVISAIANYIIMSVQNKNDDK